MRTRILLKTMFALAVMMLANMNVRGDNVVFVFADHYNNATVVSSDSINNDILFLAEKNDAGTAPTVYSADGLRLYGDRAGNGASITLLPQNGAVITNVIITAKSGYTAQTTYFVDDTIGIPLNWSSVIGSISDITAATSLKIQNSTITPSGSIPQLRIVSINVTYTTTASASDTVAPMLTFSPANNDTDVPVNTTVTITASEPLRITDGSEITNADLLSLIELKETNSGGTAVAFTAVIDTDSKVITITPSSVLAGSQVYYAAINPVADTADNVTNMQNITFTTETPSSEEENFIKINSLGELTSGYYVIVANHSSDNALTNTVTGSYINVTAADITNDTVKNPDESIIWRIEASEGKYTISNGADYVAYYGSGNNAYLVTAVNDSARWTADYQNNEFVIANAKIPARILQYNSGSPRFACYTSSQVKLHLYKMATNCTAPQLQFGNADQTKRIGDADFTFTAISATGSSGTVSYSSSNTDVAIVDPVSGTVTIIRAGITNIQATISENAGFCEGIAAYQLEVLPAIGNEKRYKLITDISNLENDKKYLIAGKNQADSCFALGWQGTNNRNAISVQYSGDTLIAEPAAEVFTGDIYYPYEITLQNSGAGWTLYDSLNEKYLTPVTGNSNYLRLADTAVLWDISITDSMAAITAQNTDFTRNTLFFNQGSTVNSPLFSCYVPTSTQQPVYLYMEIEESQVNADTVAPMLTFNPANNATDVPLNTTVTITASEPLRKTDGSEITNADLLSLIELKETNSSGTAVAFTAAIDTNSKIITVTPSSVLASSQVYYAAINPVADTADNVTVLQDITFTTASQESTDAELLAYSIINQISSSIDTTNKSVDVIMPAGTDVTNLTATFTVSAGAAATVTGTVQTSGTTANDFTNPVVYVITAEDGITTSNWTVNVSVQQNSEAEIITFTIPDQTGSSIINADEAEIIVIMPTDTDLQNLVPTITVSDYASISPSSGAAQDFTDAVTYTVTAQDGTVKLWTVTVHLANPIPSDENNIISFTLHGQTGNTVIDINTRTVMVQMPLGANLVNLIPSIYISQGATISPAADAMRDFSSSVVYTVTSASGTSATWVVTVIKGNDGEGLKFDFIDGTQTFYIQDMESGIGRVDVFANDGRLMYSNRKVNSSELNIDMSSYFGGMYIIRIWNKNHALTKTVKIIK